MSFIEKAKNFIRGVGPEEEKTQESPLLSSGDLAFYDLKIAEAESWYEVKLAEILASDHSPEAEDKRQGLKEERDRRVAIYRKNLETISQNIVEGREREKWIKERAERIRKREWWGG